MTEKSQKPSIRFKGFNDVWEQRKLEALSVDAYGGGTPDTSIEQYWTGAIPWIQSSDLVEHQVQSVNVRKYISSAGLTNSATRLVPANSIAIITRVGVGKLAIMPFSYTSSQDFLSLSKLKTDVQFTVYLLYKKLQSELNSVQGTSIKGITKDELLAKLVLIPTEKEQQQIGALFHSFDNLITLHQRKHDKLVNIKKALLENMFPENGEDTPKIRFKGFTDTWEQRKLREIGKTFTGLSGKSGDDFGHGQANFIIYMNIFKNPIANPNETEPIEIDERQNKVQYGDIFFTTSSETPDEVGMSSIWLENAGNTYLNSFCFGYRLNDIHSIDERYLAYLLRANSFRKNMILLAQGISRYNISKNKAIDIKIDLPTKTKEQTKIGALFTTLDNLITLHQCKLEKLKNIKKALLEKMFI